MNCLYPTRRGKLTSPFPFNPDFFCIIKISVIFLHQLTPSVTNVGESFYRKQKSENYHRICSICRFWNQKIFSVFDPSNTLCPNCRPSSLSTFAPAQVFPSHYRVVFLNVCENTDRNYREETQDSLNTQKLHLLFSFLLCIHKTNIRSARYSPSFHSRTPTLNNNVIVY